MLRNPFKVKTVIGNTDLSLEADPGESFKVLDILIYNPASNYITVKIDETTRGYFRVGGTLGSHLPFPLGRSQHAHDWLTGATAAGDQTSFVGLKNAGGTEIAAKMIGGLSASTTYRRAGDLAKAPWANGMSILKLLAAKGLFLGYPIATGQKLLIEGAKQSGAVQVVIYEVHDEPDMTKDMPNGSESAEYLFLNYGNAGGNINANGDTLINTPKTTKEFPAFPFGDDVPSNKIIDIIGVCASDFAPKENDGTDSIYTKYLKLMRDQEVLFDEDRNGLLMMALFTTALGNMDMVAEGQSMIGNFSDVDNKPPLFFPTPMEFLAGQELNVYLNCVKANSGQNIAIDEHEICIIEKVRKVA